MKQRWNAVLALALVSLLAVPGMAQEKRQKPKSATGTVGLVDLEKNYMILVTPKGKLITVRFTDQTKVTELVPEKAQTKDIRLRAQSTIIYQTEGDKDVLKSIKFEGRPKKR